MILISLGAFAQRAEPVGSYANGSLENGECLEESGEGYIQLLRSWDQIYGTDEMLGMIKKSAADMAKKFPGRDRLQVESIAALHGGHIDPHGSHQNGLDVDLQYFKANGQEYVPTISAPYSEPMVEAGRVSDNFDVQRNWELVKALHKNGPVQRIFMDTPLKNALCKYAKSTGDYASNINVLRSIRFVANHQDHMHVRLRCPPSARRCISQADPSPGSGCP